MFKVLILVVFIYMFSTSASYGADGVYVYSEEVGVQEEASESTGFTETTFSEDPRFNYFEMTSLNANASLFLDGLDQRFLDLTYNGFSLRDPSHPTGIFNVAVFSALRGQKLRLNNASGLDVSIENKDISRLSFGLNSLREAFWNAEQAFCETDKCFSVGVSLKRGGGYSQIEQGDEKDYYDDINLNFSRTSFKTNYTAKTHFLYSGRKLDEDTAGFLTDTTVESETAESKNSTLLLGQDYEFFKKARLKAFYLGSYRSQRDEPQGFSFRQRGGVFELEAEYKKSFSAKAFRESYNLYSSHDYDFGGQVGYKKNQR